MCIIYTNCLEYDCVFCGGTPTVSGKFDFFFHTLHCLVAFKNHPRYARVCTHIMHI